MLAVVALALQCRRSTGDRNAAVYGPSKALIKTGGENVYPAEVEAVLASHPDIEDAVVFGIPDDEWGEAVVAAIVPREGATIDVDSIPAFVATRIARYKRPRKVLVRAEIPRDDTGNIRRDLLVAASLQV